MSHLSEESLVSKMSFGLKTVGKTLLDLYPNTSHTVDVGGLHKFLVDIFKQNKDKYETLLTTIPGHTSLNSDQTVYEVCKYVYSDAETILKSEKTTLIKKYDVTYSDHYDDVTKKFFYKYKNTEDYRKLLSIMLNEQDILPVARFANKFVHNMIIEPNGVIKIYFPSLTRWKAYNDDSVWGIVAERLIGILSVQAEEWADAARKGIIKDVKPWLIMIADLVRKLSGVFAMSVVRTMRGILVTDKMINSSSQEELDLDRISGLLSLRNNEVIELETGNIRKRKKSDLISYRIDVDYKANADSSAFIKFIETIMLEDKKKDKSKTRYLLRFIGYMLTRKCDEEVLAKWIGEGSNGKSVLLKVLMSVFKGLFHNLPKSALQNKGGNLSPELDQAKDYVGAFISETNKGEKLDEAKIKMITGRDYVTTNPKYKKPRTWLPIFVPVLVTNHEIECSGSESFMRRIHYVNFNAKFVDKPTKENERLKIKDFESTLLHNKEGILKAIVDGCRDYYKQGINPPKCIIKATKKYGESQNVEDLFYSKCVSKTGNDKDIVLSRDFYQLYQQICSEEGKNAMGYTAFGRWLKPKATNDNIKEYRGKAGRGYKGVVISSLVPILEF